MVMEIMIIVVAVHRVVGVQSVAVRIEKRRTEDAARCAMRTNFRSPATTEREKRGKKNRALSAEEFVSAEIPRRYGNPGARL